MVSRKIKSILTLKGLLFFVLAFVVVFSFILPFAMLFEVRNQFPVSDSEIALGDSILTQKIDMSSGDIYGIAFNVSPDEISEGADLTVDVRNDDEIIYSENFFIEEYTCIELNDLYLDDSGGKYYLDISGTNVKLDCMHSSGEIVLYEDGSESVIQDKSICLDTASDRDGFEAGLPVVCGIGMAVLVILLACLIDFEKITYIKTIAGAFFIALILRLIGMNLFSIIIVSDYESESQYVTSMIIAMTVMFIAFATVFFFIGYASEKFGIPGKYLTLALPLVIVYLAIFTPWGIPDAQSHFLATYRFSNIVLDVDNPWQGRKADVDFYENVWGVRENPSPESYGKVVDSFDFTCSDKELVDFPNPDVKMEYYSILNYLPEVVGLVLGRLMNLGIVPSIYLGRIFLMIFYLWASYRAISRTPVGKGVFAFVFLLPMSLMMSSAISYDPIVIIATSSFIVSILVLKKEYSLGNLIEAICWIFLVGAVKGGGYLIVLPMTFVLFDMKDIKACTKKIGAVLVSGLFSVLLFDKLLVMNQHLFQFGTGNDGKLTAGYAISNPLDFLTMSLGSYVVYADELFVNIGGTKLAWLERTIPHLVICLMFLMIFIYALIEKDEMKLGKKDKYIFVSIVALGLITIPAMLLSWTVIGSLYVDGIQGRYFLPLFPLAVFALTKFPELGIINKGKGTEELEIRIFNVFAVLSVIAVYYMSIKYLII